MLKVHLDPETQNIIITPEQNNRAEDGGYHDSTRVVKKAVMPALVKKKSKGRKRTAHNTRAIRLSKVKAGKRAPVKTLFQPLKKKAEKTEKEENRPVEEDQVFFDLLIDLLDMAQISYQRRDNSIALSRENAVMLVTNIHILRSPETETFFDEVDEIHSSSRLKPLYANHVHAWNGLLEALNERVIASDPQPSQRMGFMTPEKNGEVATPDEEEIVVTRQQGEANGHTLQSPPLLQPRPSIHYEYESPMFETEAPEVSVEEFDLSEQRRCCGFFRRRQRGPSEKTPLMNESSSDHQLNAAGRLDIEDDGVAEPGCCSK